MTDSMNRTYIVIIHLDSIIGKKLHDKGDYDVIVSIIN